MNKTGYIFSKDYLNHETYEHPECKERLISINSYLKREGLKDKLIQISPEPAKKEDISLVHDIAYIESVESSCGKGLNSLDPDTIICVDSFDAALLASGGVMSAINSIFDKKADNAFCAVRPPGHHAEYDHAMGFCLFNNVAVGAKFAIERKGVKKVFILDFDVHHGNGTQHVFYDTDTVFYSSIHQYPYYPGTGAKAERGEGCGRGFNLNFPLPAYSGDDEYLTIIKEEICPKIKDYKPDLIILSAGFDAHEHDPLSSMNVSSECFFDITKELVDVSKEVCEGRLVSVLEGGYNLDFLGEAVGAHIKALINL